MIIVTTENVAGYRVVETKELIFAAAMHSYDVGQGFFKLETNAAVETLETTRARAIYRLATKAQEMGANAIILIRFDSAGIAPSGGTAGWSEIVAYGTAVVLEPVA